MSPDDGIFYGSVQRKDVGLLLTMMRMSSLAPSSGYLGLVWNIWPAPPLAPRAHRGEVDGHRGLQDTAGLAAGGAGSVRLGGEAGAAGREASSLTPLMGGGAWTASWSCRFSTLSP